MNNGFIYNFSRKNYDSHSTASIWIIPDFIFIRESNNKIRIVVSNERGRQKKKRLREIRNFLWWKSIATQQNISTTPSWICLEQRSRNYKRNLLVQGTSSPNIYLSKRLRACPDLLATDQLNYQLILQNLSWGQVPFISTCPPPFLLVPDNRTISFSNPVFEVCSPLHCWLSSF